MWIADRWQDFELIDAGDGEKLERWGEVVLQRPDPQAIWPRGDWMSDGFPQPHAVYRRSREGGGHWQTQQNWDEMVTSIRTRKDTGSDVRVLNLFAYTGAATVACAKAGASETVHLDASKGMNARARRNLQLSGMEDAYVRFFTEDARQFVERELRRGRQYDGILMDPPAYGRGPSGELWRLEDALYGLVELCAGLLSDRPLFFFINSYTTGLAPSVLGDILSLVLDGRGGRIRAEELGLPATARKLILPCGATGRWQADV